MSGLLENLILLAEKDTRIMALKKELNQVQPRLNEARKGLDAEKKTLEALENKIKALEVGIREKEATSKLALDTIEKFKEHLKNVHNQKEYSAAQKQLDDARKINDQMQSEVLEARIQLEDALPKREAAQTRLREEEAAYLSVEKAVRAEESQWQAEAQQLESEKPPLKEGVEPRMLALYNRLSGAGRNPSVVPVVAGVCTGCNMAPPPQDYNRMIAQPHLPFTCPHCGRITYYKAAEPAQ